MDEPIYDILAVRRDKDVVTMWIQHRYNKRKTGITFSLKNFLSKTLVITEKGYGK